MPTVGYPSLRYVQYTCEQRLSELMYLLTVLMTNGRRCSIGPFTGELRALGFPTRHLGPVHSRQTLVLFGVAWRVIVDYGSLLSYPFPAVTGDAGCIYKITQQSGSTRAKAL